jgi:hypothetical protein
VATTDLFGRTTAFGLDGSPTRPYTWVTRDTSYGAAADSLFHVNGSRVVLPVNDWDSYTIDWASPISVGTAQFDFFIPVLATNDNYRGPIVLRLNPAGCAQPITLAVDDEWNWNGTYDPVDDPHYRIGSANGDGEDLDGTFTTIAVEPGNTYTAKVGWLANGKSGYKLWKTSDPEPADWMAVSITGETSSFSDQWLDFWYDSDSEVAYLDNLSFDDTEPDLPSGQFTLDAIIAPPEVCDDFARTVAAGLGTGPVGDYEFVPSTDPGTYVSTQSNEAFSALSVNGSNVVTNGSSQRHVYRLPLPAALDGTLEFDIWIPASHGTDGQPIWLVRLDSQSRSRGVGFEIDAVPGSTSDYYIFRDYNGGTGITWTPASPGNWYTVKFIYGQSGAITVLVKPQGSDDSAAEATTSGTLGVDNQGYGDILVIDTPTSFSGDILDNFCYRPIEVPPPGFTLDAVLRRTQVGSVTLDASFAYQRTGSITADAVLKAAIRNEFALRAFIKGDTTAEAGTHIRVGGVDITRDVIYKDAEFLTLVNGAPGSFRFSVRDNNRTRSFTDGAEVTLDIDGVRRFGGYVTQVTETYFFPVVDTSDVTKVQRLLTLIGVDYNILFSKRVLYDKGHPADVELRSWPAGTQDDTIIRYALDHYTDLYADGVVFDGVDHVGFPNPDHAGIVGSGGLYFGDFMHEVNRLIGAVWYLDPYKRLTFADVDVPNASVGLSDRPGPGQVGYREFRRSMSAAKMANDAFVWGAAQGWNRLAFSRATDAPSIAAHGLWQYGEFSTQMYKQASVDQRADSIVNGTPQSKRGGKDDQVSWELATFSTAFVVGQKVEIENEVWGVSDVVPIRRMRITFPVKNHARFDLGISHEIDEPWNIFESFFPRFRIPRFPITEIKDPPPQQLTCWVNPPEWLDDFNRNLINEAGCTSWGGYQWFPTGGVVGDDYGSAIKGSGAGDTPPSGWPDLPTVHTNFVLDGRMGIYLPTDYRQSNARASVVLPLSSTEDEIVVEFDAFISQATFNEFEGVSDGVGADMVTDLSIGFSGLNIDLIDESGPYTHIAGFDGGDFYTQRTAIDFSQFEDAPDVDLGGGSYISIGHTWVGTTGIWRNGVHVKIESHKFSSTQKTVKLTVGAVAIQQTLDYDDNHFSPQTLTIGFGIIAGLQSDDVPGPHTLTPYPSGDFYSRIENLRIQTTSGTCDVVAQCLNP